MKMNNFNKGYGFRPSDEELIEHLRNRTLFGRDYLVQDITDLGDDICKWEPWDLPGRTMNTSSDPVWYFVYPITFKYPKCKRKGTNERANDKRKPMINRATEEGKWKLSGNPRKVRASDSKKDIGIKTSLYFHSGRAKEKSNRKNKARHQSSYQNKTPWVLYQYELIDVPSDKNELFLGKLMKQSEPSNIPSFKGETSQQLPSNYLENRIPTPEVQLDFDEPLVEMEVSNDYDWTQNQSNISEQANEFVINSNYVENYETYPVERSNQENFVNDYEVSNLQYDLENYVAEDAIPQNLQVDRTELITKPEVPNLHVGTQYQLDTSQHDNFFQNLVLINNDETYLEGRSNQHNVIAESEGFNLPYNFDNHPIADISQMNLFDFDDLYFNGLHLHELFGAAEAPNNYDGVQNQTCTNQQDAGESRNSNFIDNESANPDERSKSAAAEIQGSNLPSLGMTESSYPMWSFRKRSGMEQEGSSIDIETEVTQAQAKKSRF